MTETTASILPKSASDSDVERPFWPAVLRGWRGRCPACGEGRIMEGYLKVRQTCPSCGGDLSHQRADDGPAYMTILVVGHIMAPLILVVFNTWRPSPLVLITTFSIGTVALSLWLLPRFKGALVGLQWAKRMHGFGGRR
ncbi:DUF983 domain-containing protein [Haematobacter missouriensis]|uniref:DUF983 domain-containing protein n=1 Tax=Haematobacter missouriensis TaxID=366616 RepID=A0A212AYP6_9RHOB|nr:DUF983 domain-containing protein [Haematobacter missouriensis]OWJ86609.1 hypothetical protein CDV52_01260 [Haematobacter missouriensis]